MITKFSSKEELVQQFKLIHSNKYDYSLLQDAKIYKKLKIICPIHGEFKQLGYSHLKGSQCRKCHFIKLAKINKQKILLSKLSYEEKENVIKLHNAGMSGREISDSLNNKVSQDDITRFLRRQKLPDYLGRRQYKINEDYFEKIDNPDKAYILGLLAADGYNDEIRGKVEISLQEEDGYILQEICDKIFENRKISYRKVYGEKNKIGNVKTSYRLNICSRKVSQDLTKCGIKQNKSFMLKWPEIDSMLNWHFIRGLFDGDGCICKKRRGISFSIICTVQLANKIKEIFNEIGVILSVYYKKYKNNKILSVVYTGKIENLYKIYNCMYDKNNMFLIRKKNKFKEIFDRKENPFEL